MNTKILQGVNISTGKFHAKIEENSSHSFGEGLKIIFEILLKSVTFSGF